MLPPRKPWLIEWLFCLGLFFAGIGIGSLLVFVHYHGTTPEEELTLVEGVPTDVELTRQTGQRGDTAYFLTFKVGEYFTEYSSLDPRFDDVLSAVRADVPLRVWVSTKQETVFPRRGRVPLYKLSTADKMVLTYPEVVGRKANRTGSILILGGTILSLGAWGTYRCFRLHRRYTAWCATRSAL